MNVTYDNWLPPSHHSNFEIFVSWLNNFKKRFDSKPYNLFFRDHIRICIVLFKKFSHSFSSTSCCISLKKQPYFKEVRLVLFTKITRRIWTPRQGRSTIHALIRIRSKIFFLRYLGNRCKFKDLYIYTGIHCIFGGAKDRIYLYIYPFYFNP